jgi:hypothetical protein
LTDEPYDRRFADVAGFSQFFGGHENRFAGVVQNIFPENLAFWGQRVLLFYQSLHYILFHHILFYYGLS